MEQEKINEILSKLNNGEELTEEEHIIFDVLREEIDYIITNNEEYILMDEAKQLCFKCEDCGQWFKYEEENYYTIQPSDCEICESCFYEGDYGSCNDCGDCYGLDDLITIYDSNLNIYEYVCEDCAEDEAYFYCEDCQRYFLKSVESFRRPDDCVICSKCFHGDYVLCDDCGVALTQGECEWIEDDNGYEECYCQDCAQKQDQKRVIHAYSYKPEPVFFGEPCDIHYGVELEIDDASDTSYPKKCAEEIITQVGSYVYCKHDESLDNGVEIVSHPCTLEYHQQKLPWEQLMNICLNHDFASHDPGTCGLHVHIERAKIGNDTPEKLVLLSDTVWNDLFRFSRRNKDQLSYSKKPNLDLINPDIPQDTVDKETILKAKAKKSVGGGRYQAVNLENTNTVEIRIFRGTLLYSTFAATLQLVDNMVHFCNDHTFDEISTATFSDVIAVNPTEELIAYCKKRKIELYIDSNSVKSN